MVLLMCNIAPHELEFWQRYKHLKSCSDIIYESELLNFTTENWIGEKFRQITCRAFSLPTINTFIYDKFNSMHPHESWENCIHCWESQTLSILYTFHLTIAKPWEEIIPITIITIYWVLWVNWIVGNHWSLPIFSLGDLNVQPD